MRDGELAHQPWRIRQACRVGRTGQQHLERQRQQRTGRRHHQRLHAIERTRHTAERHLVKLLVIRDVECRQPRRRQFDAGADAAHQFADLLHAAVDLRYRDGAVAQQEHPAFVVAEHDRGERLIRVERRKHVLGRHDFLHQLAVIGGRRLQGRIGIGERRLRVRDPFVEIGAGDRAWCDRRALTLCVGESVSLAVQIGQLGGRILAMTNRLRHFGIARILRQTRGRLGDLLAGDATLRELCGGEHLGQQDLALVAFQLRRGGGVHIETRRHQHRRRASLQSRQRLHRATANRQCAASLAGLLQLSRSQQEGIRQRFRSWQ